MMLKPLSLLVPLLWCSTGVQTGEDKERSPQQNRAALKKTIKAINSLLHQQTYRKTVAESGRGPKIIDESGWKAQYAEGDHVIFTHFRILDSRDGSGKTDMSDERVESQDVPLQEMHIEDLHFVDNTFEKPSRLMVLGNADDEKKVRSVHFHRYTAIGQPDDQGEVIEMTPQFLLLVGPDAESGPFFKLFQEALHLGKALKSTLR